MFVSILAVVDFGLNILVVRYLSLRWGGQKSVQPNGKRMFIISPEPRGIEPGWCLWLSMSSFFIRAAHEIQKLLLKLDRVLMRNQNWGFQLMIIIMFDKAKVIALYPEGEMNICTKFHGNPSKGYWDICYTKSQGCSILQSSAGFIVLSWTIFHLNGSTLLKVSFLFFWNLVELSLLCKCWNKSLPGCNGLLLPCVELVLDDLEDLLLVGRLLLPVKAITGGSTAAGGTCTTTKEQKKSGCL